MESNALTIVTSNEDLNSSKHTLKSYEHQEANLDNQDQPDDDQSIELDIGIDQDHETKERRNSSQ